MLSGQLFQSARPAGILEIDVGSQCMKVVVQSVDKIFSGLMHNYVSAI